MAEQKTMKQKLSNLFFILIAVVVVAYCGYSFLTGDLEHIEDTNGADNYALTVITDENIINQDMGSMGLTKTESILNSGITFSSNKFTGVYRIFTTNFLFNSDFMMDVMNFHVNSGNFKMVIVNEGEIIATVEPDMMSEVVLHDLNGTFELVIAGESADFTFYLDSLFCEQYDIRLED